MYDSLGDGFSDGEYDFDEDGLDNIKEYETGTHPHDEDYDCDGLLDGDEIIHYGTDPMKGDTDEEGLRDGDEIVLGTSPLLQDTDGDGILDCNEKFMQEYVYKENDEMSIISEVILNINATGNVQKTTTVDSMKGMDPVCENVVGLVGSPYAIETESEFDTAVISFKVDMSKMNEKALDDYIVLWYDEENCTFVEMETKYDEVNGTISTETTHFSRYMIVDKTAWFEAWSEELNYTNVQYEKSACYTVLAVDCSGSMSSSDPITIIADTSYPYINIRDCKRHDAVVNYVGAMDSDDKAAIVAFDSSATTLCGMTDSKLELSYAARKFYSSGGTNYNNVLTESIAILDNSEGSTRKKIVLLSDGKASVSDSVLESAKSSNIKIYTVGLGNSSDSVLQNIADETGGEFFKAYTADELVDIYEEIGVAVDIDTTDTDGDGLYDVYETAGMRLQNGKIIYTDPLLKDTDGDGLEDGQEIDPEMKQLYASGMPSDVAEIQPYYFVMYSNPTLKDSDNDSIEDGKDPWPMICHDFSILESYVKRDDWESAEIDWSTADLTYVDNPIEYYDTIVIHHTARSQNESIEDLEQHMMKDGYDIIGYHFVITADGTVYEGRPITYMGAHVYANNENKIAVSLTGNFHPDANDLRYIIKGAMPTEPTAEQYKSMELLIKILKTQYGIDYIGGHRDFDIENPTECPGDTLYTELENDGYISLP